MKQQSQLEETSPSALQLNLIQIVPVRRLTKMEGNWRLAFDVWKITMPGQTHVALNLVSESS